MAKRSDEVLYALPETTELRSAATVELNALLTEAHSLAGVESRLKQIKDRIKELAQGYPGVRYGDLCAIVRFQTGKKSLDRALLVENGVTPEQLEAGTKEGAGYWVCELPRIGAAS